MVAVGLFTVGRAFSPAHRKVGDADGGDIGKIVNRVIQKGDAAAQDSAENFRDDKAESHNHGPAKDGGAECGVSVAGVDMIVAMRMTGVIVAVRMRAHAHHSTHSMDTLQPSSALIRQFDTPLPGMD